LQTCWFSVYNKFFTKVIDLYKIDPNNLGMDGSPTSVSAIWEKQEITKFFRAYRLCGRDENSASISWIAGNGIEIHEEKQAIHASTLFYFANYGDLNR